MTVSSASDLTLMPEVFLGAAGDLVILQEWPALQGDEFIRVYVPMDRVLDLAAAIIEVARRAGAAA